MKKEEVKTFLLNRKGYQSWGAERIAAMTNSDIETVKRVLAEIKQSEPLMKALTGNGGTRSTDGQSSIVGISKEEYEAFLAYKEFTKELNQVTTKVNSRVDGLVPYDGNPNNVLVIGDLHTPFDLEDYLKFCREQQEVFDCGTVIFIGDLIDGCSYNFHEKNPDGLSQKDEINSAIGRLKDWYKVFPTAKITLGNHDLLIARKLKYVGLSSAFMKDFRDIWQMPTTWEVGMEFIINEVKYTHGDKGNAISVAKDSRISTVQGHMHTQGFVEYAVSEKDRIFGCQVGCGIDHKAYAFEYSKGFAKKPFIGCGVILNSGKLPIVIPMEL